MIYKSKNSYKTISEVVKIMNLNSLDNKNNKPHTLRFWETQFKQIKPKKINNRRYYDQKNIDVLLKIQFLLKNQGMTINGVKKALNDNHSLNLDDFSNKSISIDNVKIKNKLKKISNLVKELKKLK